MTEEKQTKHRKFNVIIGNPPFENSDGGNGASSTPLYNKFIEASEELQPDVISYIIPSRWYTGGKGLDSFRNLMLTDIHLKKLCDYRTPEDVFPNTNIRGGVCTFVWEKDFDNSKTGVKVVSIEHRKVISKMNRPLDGLGLHVFLRDNNAFSILKKVGIDKSKSFMQLVSVRQPFGLAGTFIRTDNFKATKDGLKEPVVVYGKGKKGYTERSLITKNSEWIDKIKVLTARANNVGTELHDDNWNGKIANGGEVCTETYIVVGADLNLTKASAQNIIHYMQTKFARYLLGLSKTGHDASRKTYRFVPIQDFTDKSDIDWAKSIPEIDQQLYDKYGLSDDEISFIEKNVKEMK